MKSVIEEIYNHECGYNEIIKPNEGYWKVHKAYDEIFEKLLKTLNKEQKKWLDDLFVQGSRLEAELAETHFTEGFKLGLRLATECLK